MIDFELERKLKLCLNVSGHPVTTLPAELQERYLIGLGSVLSKISVSNLVLKYVYDRWCIAICGHTFDAFFPHLPRAKAALGIYHIGIRCFRMSWPFIFDCFYLTELFNPEMTGNVRYYLHDCVCGISTRGTLQNVRMLFWKEIRHKNIPEILLTFRDLNRSFNETRAKKVLVVANMSAGKSTLINAITGYRINSVANTACTSKLKYIFNKPFEDGFSLWTSTSQNFENCEIDNEIREKDSDAVAFHFRSSLRNRNICFIDSPGINYIKDKSHEEITFKTIEKNDYDLILFVADGRYPGTTDEMTTLTGIVSRTQKPIIVAINQLDVYDPEQDSVEKTLSLYKSIMNDVLKAETDIIPITAWLGLMEKIPHEELDEQDARQEQYTRNLFEQDFYDLQRYITQQPSQKLLDRTGISLLEKIIELHLFS